MDIGKEEQPIECPIPVCPDNMQAETPVTAPPEPEKVPA